MLTRPKKITFRVTEREYAKIRKNAARAKFKIEPYIRSCIDGSKVYEAPPVDWVGAVRQMSAIGNNISQIAQMANISRTVSGESIAEVKALMQEIRDLVWYQRD